ncbi:hypothetical protein [Agathobaculum sp.]|mgnify:FL=1|uniref:hypothetical protein n=1 Tax=Agathobaculum sp. TaxID=2048138 RepID=UPI003FD6CFE8
MKKRHAALAALALVGILSGCGQTKTQPADNTISITPVEQKTKGSQIDKSVKYEFSGNHADANGIEIQRYEWDGSAWNKDEFGHFTVNAEDIGKSSGIIQFDPESDAVNAEYNIDVQSEHFGGSIQCANSDILSDLPVEQITSSVAMQEEPIDDLAVDVEIPLLVRTFRTDGTQILVAIDAFSDPGNSSALKYSSYAEAYTVKFVKNDHL